MQSQVSGWVGGWVTPALASPHGGWAPRCPPGTAVPALSYRARDGITPAGVWLAIWGQPCHSPPTPALLAPPRPHPRGCRGHRSPPNLQKHRGARRGSRCCLSLRRVPPFSLALAAAVGTCRDAPWHGTAARVRAPPAAAALQAPGLGGERAGPALPRAWQRRREHPLPLNFMTDF